MSKKHSPASFLKPQSAPASKGDGQHGPKSVGLIILNQPIQSRNLAKLLWDSSSYHLCADGGANRLLEISDKAGWCPIPDMVIGDLDSISDKAREFYSARGVKILKDPCQESTDFGKGLGQLLSVLEPDGSGHRDILILGSISGRVDQGLGLLHEILRETTNNENLRLWLFSEQNVSFVLSKGHHTIETPLRTNALDYHFGVIPVYGPAVISTEGLRWDIKDWDTRMGLRVSTSNHVIAEAVQIVTTSEVLVTIELGSAVIA